VTRTKTEVSFWSVRTFLIWLVLACLLPGVIGAVILFAHQYRDNRAQQETDMILTARALVHTVDSHLLRGRAIAQALSSADSLVMRDFDRFHQRARETVATTGAIANVVLRDAEGRQLLNTTVDFGAPLTAEPAPEQVREVFASGKPTISGLFFGPVLRQPIVSVDVPVVIDGKVAYALGVGILPEHFSAIVTSQNLPPAWIAAVLDSSGTVVGRNRDAEKFVGNKATEKLYEAMAKSPEGTLSATTQEGTPVLTFFSRSSATDWRVAIGIPSKTLDAALVLPLSMLAAGVATLFGIGLLLAWLIGGRIAHSVKALTSPAAALGSDGPIPAPRVHVKEAAEVAAAIDRAAALLKERTANLQTRNMELAEAHRLAKFGTWHWDLASGDVIVADSVCEIYGREVPSFPEQRGTLLTVESWESVSAAAEQAVQTGKGYDLELAAMHADGHTIWISAKCEAIRNEKEEVVALRGTIQDITERKMHEQALRKSELDALEGARDAKTERSRLDAVLQATPVGIVVADANGAIVEANTAHRHLWGENQPTPDSTDAYREWQGWWADGSRRHGRPLNHADWPMTRALHGEMSRDIIEIATFDAPPSRRIAIISGAPIRDRDGGIIGGVIAQMDITDRMKAEEALRQADRRKDEFLAMLAHELRNPLAPIAAAADLLGFARLDESRIKQTSIIIARQARHMTGLIDDLLDVSRVTRGLISLEKHLLDAERVVADAVEQARPLFDARGHDLAIRMPAEPVFFLGDHKRLVQALTNLLTNAAKFTPDGGNIVLNVKIAGEHVEMTVTDNGIGMTPDLVTRAFDLFSQGERTPDRAQGGLGIGLALVKSLIELHGGSVTAVSEGIGKGSTLRICLPYLKTRDGNRAAGQQFATGTSAARSLRVMIVDDNTDAAHMLAMFVEALGHRVIVEHSSRSAFERARVAAPNVCLLDIGLPEMDGNELARRLRAQPETANAILVAVTGYGQDLDRRMALDAGFDHHFVKPLDTAKLASLLGEVDKS
jgi:signal transduction histidine kinase